MSMQRLDENFVENRCDDYLKKYSDHINLFESKGMIAKCNESVSAFDVYALGRQLELFEDYQNFLEQRGSVADLGAIPNIALDVITATQTTSITPLLASIQPMSEERGIIYHKQITAETTEGGFTAGQVINDAVDGQNVHTSAEFGGGTNVKQIFETADGVSEYTVSLGSPLRPASFNAQFVVGGTMYMLVDDGKGNLLGNGVTGKVTSYQTGTIEITFATAPGSVDPVIAKWAANLELQEDLATIGSGLVSTDIEAEIFAIKSEIGLLQEFSFSKRFGRSAEDETARDLTNEMTRVTDGAVIKRLYGAAQGNSVWHYHAPKGVARKDHKDSFLDTIAEAEGVINANSGKGTVSRLIAGSRAATTLAGLDGFVRVEGGLSQQIGLFGYLNGIPVIRASKVIPDAEIVAVYKGQGYFESPIVVAPYMPLFVSNTMPVTNNPLRNQRVAAVWTGIKPVIKNFITKITVDYTSAHPQDVIAEQVVA